MTSPAAARGRGSRPAWLSAVALLIVSLTLAGAGVVGSAAAPPESPASETFVSATDLPQGVEEYRPMARVRAVLNENP